MRAEPKTLTAGPSSARAPNPSTNSLWIRMTRHGSVWSQSARPLLSSSRWSVVVPGTRERRSVTGPVWLAGLARVLFSGRCRRVKVFWGDFFRCELEDADVVYCHLMPAVMGRIGAKCREEMRPGSRVLSYLWEVPGWTPVKILKLGRREDPLFVYEIPAHCQENDPADCGPKT